MTKTVNKELYTSKEFYVLGTSNILKAYGGHTENAIYEAMLKLLDIDDKMSIFKDYSEFSKININAGKASIAVSDQTYYVIQKAVQYANLSDGAFDPTISPILKLWGIGRSNPKVPTQEAIDQKLQMVNYKDIILNDNDKTVKLANQGQYIDGGSIVKGYAADVVKNIFIRNGIESAIIDLGGNISVISSKHEGIPWRVGIQNPLGTRGEFIGVLNISDKSVVTSGGYERFFEEYNKKYHHIIDPRTGYPSDNGVISTTIVSDKSIDSDALSTCVYVLGVEKGLKLIECLKGIDVIFITEDRKAYISSGIKDNFNLTNNAFTLTLEYRMKNI